MVFIIRQKLLVNVFIGKIMIPLNCHSKRYIYIHIQPVLYHSKIFLSIYQFKVIIVNCNIRFQPLLYFKQLNYYFFMIWIPIYSTMFALNDQCCWDNNRLLISESLIKFLKICTDSTFLETDSKYCFEMWWKKVPENIFR